MNNFPCKNCLVRVNCSQYCDKLETSPRVIDIYIVSLKQCPDCGSYINMGTDLNKTAKICFECSKVFHQDPFVKLNHPNHNLVRSTTSAFKNPSDKDIITDLQEPTKAEPHTMEETHDILYDRVVIHEANYIIRKIELQLKNHIMTIPKKLKPMNKPKSGDILFSNPTIAATPSIIY